MVSAAEAASGNVLDIIMGRTAHGARWHDSGAGIDAGKVACTAVSAAVSAGALGVYADGATFTATDKDESSTSRTGTTGITVTVKDAVIQNEATGEAIGGNNFTITADQAAAIIAGDTASAITLGSVSAVNTETGANVTIASVDASKLSTAPGTYPVTFTTAAGTSVTVYVTVTESGSASASGTSDSTSSAVATGDNSPLPFMLVVLLVCSTITATYSRRRLRGKHGAIR